MSDRNVNVRLQVIDGGKAKAEFVSVGQAGAAALDSLQQKSVQAAAAVNQLRTHEVTNLSAQLTDLGVQVLSGQSFATAMIQQGPQIAAVLGDRGVKASLLGVGQGLASLVTPTTAVLAGIVALGYGASYVFDAIAGDAEDATDKLSKHDEIVRRIAERYGEAKDAADEYSDARRQIDIADSRANAETQARDYAEEVSRLLRDLTTKSVSIDTAGNIVANPIFDVFAEAVARLSAEARDGSPDIEAFRGAVAGLINATDNPAVVKFGRELLEAAGAAQEMQERVEASGDSAQRAADKFALSAEQLKKFSAAMKEWDKNQRLVADMQSRAETVDDPRQRAIDAGLGRLGANATEEQRAAMAAAAGERFDREQAQREKERQSREALAEARQRQNALESEAERLYRRTRTAGEAYAETLAKLNGLLADGRIDQETYGRAVAQAEEVMRQAERAALDRSTRAADGYTRAIDDYLTSARDLADATEQLTVDALGGAEDAFVQFVTTGKASFGDLIDAMLADLARLAFRQSMAGLLSAGGSDWLGSLINGAVGAITGGFGGAGNANVAGYMAAGYANTNTFGGPRALGGAVKEGFDYWVGENGPEKFTAPRDGQIIPTSALKAATPPVTVNIHNAPAGSAARAQVSSGAQGQLQIDVIFEQLEGRLAENVAKRRGPLGAAMETSYALNPMRGRGR